MSDPPKKRRRSLLANSIFGVLSWFSPIVLGLVSTPVLVGGLGDEAYGVYALILGLLSYSFTFGIGRAASKYVAEYTSANVPAKLSAALTSVLIFSIAIGSIGAGILALLTPYLVTNVLQLPENLRQQAESGIYIACVTGVMVMISQVFQSALQGAHRFGSYLAVSSLGAFLLSTGNIVLAVTGHGIVVLLAWNLFATLTIGTIFFVAAVQAVPDFRPTLRLDADTIKMVTKYGSQIILSQVFGNALFILERTIVVRRFGPDGLTYYAVPMLLGIYIHGAISGFVLALFPRLNELLNDQAELTRLYRKVNRLVIALIVIVAVSLVVNGKQFLLFWVGPQMSELGSSVLPIHVLSFSIVASFVIVWQIAESHRAAGINVAMTFTWFVVAGGSFFTVVGNDLGLPGVAYARLAAVLLTVPVIFYIERRFLGEVQIRYWAALLLRVSIAAIVSAITQLLVISFLGQDLVSFVLSLLAGILVYLLSLLIVGFFERDELERAVRSLRFR